LTYWILPLSALFGVGLGLRFRAASVAAASVVLPVVVGVAGYAHDWGAWRTLATAGAALVSLQAGFIAGAALSRR
jgi:hypothetical protein